MSALSLPEFLPPLRLVKGDQIMSEEQAPYGDGSGSPGEASGGEQHARIPDAILYCTAIPVGARLLYGALQRHKGDKGCFPSVRTLADELGVSTRSVEQWTDALIEVGAVVVDEHGGGRRSNRYELTGKVRSVVPSTTKPPRRRSPRSVAASTTKDAASVVPATTQRGTRNYAASYSVPQSHSHIAKAIEPEPSAATQRDAPAAPSVPARASPEPTNAQANESTPSKPKRSTARKASDNASEQEQGARRAAAVNRLARVIDLIRQADPPVPLVVRGAADGAAVNHAGILPYAPEVIAEAYVAFARGEAGRYRQENLGIAFVCSKLAGYLAEQSTPAPSQRASPREGAAQGFARLARGEGW